MSTKTKRVLSVILLAVPALAVILSATMKLVGNEMIVKSLSRQASGLT
jgi:hypothetical protein